MRLSKSQYIRGLQCHKALWLYKYRRELQPPPDAQLQTKFETGMDVGILAQQLFPGGKEIVFDRGKFGANIDKTDDLIQKGVATIYEATFLYDDVLVMVDNGVKGSIETWRSPFDAHVNQVETVIFKNQGVSRRLRTTNPYQPHRQIALHDRVPSQNRVANLQTIRSQLLPLI